MEDVVSAHDVSLGGAVVDRFIPIMEASVAAPTVPITTRRFGSMLAQLSDFIMEISFGRFL